ncbi:TPA: hypothetical protein ACK3Q6_004466 [Burkholderia cepacia]
MTVKTIKFTPEEEAFIRHRMEMAGETNFSAHIKRVYFGHLKPTEGPLGAIKTNTDLMLDMLVGLADRPEKEEQSRDAERRILSGIYYLLHMSASKDKRAFVDRVIDAQAIENYLKSSHQD